MGIGPIVGSEEGVDPPLTQYKKRAQYFRGRRKEQDVKKHLEALGYVCMRSAGSKGAFDIVAIARDGVRFIQVKYGLKYPGQAEIDKLGAVPVPSNCSRELWYYKTGTRTPEIIVLRPDGA